MGIDREYKLDSSIVAGWVLHYEEKKQEYINAVDTLDVGVQASKLELVPIHGSLPGDRTGAQAIKLASAASTMDRNREWLQLVEDVEAGLAPKMQLFLRLRWDVVDKEGKIKSGRYKGRPSWIPYVQHKYCAGVAKMEKKRVEDCWVESPGVFTGWWNRIVAVATYLAAKRGLI